MHDIKVMAKHDGIVHWVKSKNKPESMKKDRKALGKLGLIMQPDNNDLIV